MPKIMQDLIKQYVEAVIKKVPVPGKKHNDMVECLDALYNELMKQRNTDSKEDYNERILVKS